MTDANITSVDNIEQFGKPPEGVAKRWKSEIDLFESQNKDWFDCAKDIEKLYRNEKNGIR